MELTAIKQSDLLKTLRLNDSVWRMGGGVGMGFYTRLLLFPHIAQASLCLPPGFLLLLVTPTCAVVMSQCCFPSSAPADVGGVGL